MENNLEFKSYYLGNLINISSSKRIFAREYKKNGIPFYRSKEIIEKFNRNKVTQELFISKEKYKEIKSKYGVPLEGDLLLTSVGTLGIPYIVKKEEFYFKDGNLTWFKNFKKLNNIYLYYWFFSKEAISQINSKQIGSTQKALTITNLKDFKISLPSLLEQEKISGILLDLDKKIEVNEKIIANLEEQAQAIFKSWFVDFEPFQDGNFVESELGMIPEGWEVKTIGEISKIRSGKRPENKLEKGDIPIYGANGITGWTDKVLINEPSILIGRVGTLGKVQRLNKKIWASDNTLIFTSQYLDFLYFNLLRIDYNSLNRGSTQPLITQKDISNINIVYPDINVMDDFLKNIGNYFTYIFKLEFQNKKLAEIRDALLPRLMSGEIDVSNIKIKGEEVRNE